MYNDLFYIAHNDVLTLIDVRKDKIKFNRIEKKGLERYVWIWRGKNKNWKKGKIKTPKRT